MPHFSGAHPGQGGRGGRRDGDMSWNVLAPCAAHSARAASAAAMVAAALPGAALGLASGALLHGNVGSSRQRFHTTLGLVMQNADALAGTAAAWGVPCLACYLADPPAVLLPFLRPVDTWGLLHGGSMQARRVRCVTIEQPDLRRIAGGRLEAAEKEVDQQEPHADLDATLDPHAAAAQRYRKLYRAALEDACPDAVASIEAMAAEGGDDALKGVAARLR